jgi:anti-sigma factor RsiW
MTDSPRVGSPAPPLDCDATVRRLWDYLDEELDVAQAAAVALHLRSCDGCRAHFAFADHFLAALHEQWPAAQEPSSLRDRVIARLTAEGVRAA